MAVMVKLVRPATVLFTVFLVLWTAAAQEPTYNFQFTEPLYNASIPENAEVRTYITTQPKTGIYVPLDSDIIGVKYILLDEDRLFRATDERVGDFVFLRIRTIPCKSKDEACSSVINREQKAEYRLRVKATGRIRGQSPVTAQTTVVVRVTDANDQRPLFLERSYSVSVPENMPVETSIITVEATDADSGTNGEVYYSFKRWTDQFAIHPTSGVVTLTRALDYQQTSQYSLIIIAKDRGMMPYNMAPPFEATLRVDVEEVNKHAPVMIVQMQMHLSRNSEIGTVYASIMVSDEDDGRNGQISDVRIVDGDPEEYFQIVNEGGIFHIKTQLSFKGPSPTDFNLTIVASDQGNPPKTATEVIPVKISGTYKHAMFFRSRLMNISISELVPINTPLISVAPENEDLGLTISYSLAESKSPVFSINERTGYISLRQELDREMKSVYDITVYGTVQESQAVAYVVVNVLDANDNNPEFAQKSYEVEIQENLAAHTPVVQVTAQDEDLGENAFISYSLANMNPVPFTIDHMTGFINTSKILDYETMRREYRLRVRASDWGAPFRRESEVIVTIRLQNINDNRPRFEKIDCVGTISRTLSPGESIALISAIDFDGDERELSIVSGNTGNLFALHPASGNLTLRRQIEDTDGLFYSLRIMASDGENSASYMYTNISINNNRNINPGAHVRDSKVRCKSTSALTDIRDLLLRRTEDMSLSEDIPDVDFAELYNANHNNPQFDDDFPTIISVREDVAVGNEVVLVKASDRDPGFNGKLIYAISDGNDDSHFQMDFETGVLRVLRPLDREQDSSYALTIKVSDLGQPRSTEKRHITINVEDVNDNAPVFDQTQYDADLSEDTYSGMVFLAVHASDRDIGRNRDIRYSIVSDSPQFAINSGTGELRVTQSLDRELTPVHKIKVQANDMATSNPLSSTTMVTVTIQDINDNPPRCMRDIFSVRMREDLPTGTVLMTVQALDPDEGPNGQVTFGITDETGTFAIDEQYGTLRLISELDYESVQIYDILINLRDHGSPANRSECHVFVQVVDVNENRHTPTFNSFYDEGTVLENATIGTEVMRVTAVDRDTGMDGSVSYSIKDGSGLGWFTIDNGGTIRTAELLDRESIPYFWLTVYGQDHGAVPLHSILEVFIRIGDVNDNSPIPTKAIFEAYIPENSPALEEVIRVEATDPDETSNQALTYEITSGNAYRHFAINSYTGVITTTDNALDREREEYHTLQITVHDNGSPSQSAITHVIVHIQDENDNPPTFNEGALVSINVPAQDRTDEPRIIYVAMASDKDIGENGELSYYIREGNNAGKFDIDPTTGIISTTKLLMEGDQYNLVLEVLDNGRPTQQWARFRLVILISAPVAESPNPPMIVDAMDGAVSEKDPFGTFVTNIFAYDPDDDDLWYSIKAGDDNNNFFMQPSSGIIFVASKLDAERQLTYDLTIAVSDGFHEVTQTIRVSVLNANDNPPLLEQLKYTVDIYENTTIGMEILQVRASDRDRSDRLTYSLKGAADQTSLSMFRVHSKTGMLTTIAPLDHEMRHRHVLTIQVKDHTLVTHRNYTRVVVNILDSNDHAPEFGASAYEGRVFETAAVGTQITQVYAYDKDQGTNAEVTYSIISVNRQDRPQGNIGEAFNIDPILGIITVGKELDRKEKAIYDLTVKAKDHGAPSLSSFTTVTVSVTLSNNAPPKFSQAEHIVELMENGRPNQFVMEVVAVSRSSVYYRILDGNHARRFDVNANTGVITTEVSLDFEEQMYYNLTLEATNMVGLSCTTQVLIHVQDVNDNPPFFTATNYEGSITESAPLSSVVLDAANQPLVIAALDTDSDRNAQLVYEIVEPDAQKYFMIDPSTGAIRTRMALDHEDISQFDFSVQVHDSGEPELWAASPAHVTIHIVDINDSPPEFTLDIFEANLLLPTFEGVTVLTLEAVDLDTVSISQLEYSIITGNQGKEFTVDATTGVLVVADSSNIQGTYELGVRVTDGLYYGYAEVSIQAVPRTASELRFALDDIYTVIQENDTTVRDLAFLNVLGNGLNEPLTYSILNPDGMFDIRPTSGVLRNTGVAFDREKQDQYNVVVEARDMRDPPRMAHVIVHVEILDVNDNVPVFVHHLFNAIVQVDANIGEVVRQVTAVDRDKGLNGEVKYTLVEGGEGHFDIDSTTGTIVVRRPLRANSQNKNFTLKIKASDKGKPRHSAVVDVPITVQNKAMPLFQEQYYQASILENIQLHSAIIQIQAISPHGRDVLYSVSGGDQFNQFDINPNTGVVNVIGPIDYESQQAYRLTIQASDTLTGAFASVMLDITVLDINDIAPSFHQKVYQTTLSEAVSVGSTVARVQASDLDSPANSRIEYRIITEGEVASFFHLDPDSGLILTSQVLDYERYPRHDFVVLATDSGVPMLSSETRITVLVLDMNDNPPVFSQAQYECTVSELAARGEFVTAVTATDPDISDTGKLTYSIVSGNDKMAFAVNSKTGVISLSNTHEPSLASRYTLNVSVSDRVFTSSAQVRVSLAPVNRHAPEFSLSEYNIEFPENETAGGVVFQVVANDADEGPNGDVTYSIIGHEARMRFEIDSHSGEIRTRVPLDQENSKERTISIPIMASDPGGKTSYTKVNVILTDKNDNRPQFERQQYEAFIPADLEVGSEIIKVSANDADLGSNSQLTYYFDNGTSDSIIDQFEINTQTGLLSVRQSLQGKEGTQFVFFMKATDSGAVSLIGRVPVSIYVLGSHDELPIFQGQEQMLNFELSEDHAIGDTITTLTAQSNRTLMYSLVLGTDPRTNHPAKFSIGRDDGVLSVTSQLDYDTCKWYKLIVKAETQEVPGLANFLEVAISVLDVNDNPPVFDDSSYEIRVPENIPVDSEILQVHAMDVDSAIFGQISYNLAPSEEDEDLEALDMFAVDSETGVIKTKASLDWEMFPSFTMVVVATDGEIGEVQNTAETTVHVVLMDFNDSPPRFTHPFYAGQVLESVAIGTVVTAVLATDSDLGSNSNLVYYITEGDPFGHFAIESNSGQIFVSRELDRELKESYNLNVTVTDGAYMDATMVTITVLDVNDNTPICAQTVYSDDVTESLPSGTDIIQVSASDIDAGDNAVITYSLSGDDAALFAINPSTGQISSAGPLDYETQSLYHFEALASDGSFSCVSQIFVGLLDENDNAPIFSSSVYNESVSENTTLNTLLTRIQAIDPDTGINRQFSFSIMEPDIQSFSIDPSSGIITLRQVLDRENRSIYNLTLQATDANNPFLVSQALLVVNVLDENDNEPQFEHDLYNASLSEDVAIGTTVVTVEALTKDVGVNALITYEIISGNEHNKFHVDEYTGKVTVANSLDFEMSNSYYLTIKATDSGLRPLSDTTMVSIYITDANDNVPQFGQIIYYSEINEVARVEDSIVQILATDADSGAYGEVTYSILRGDLFDQFTINEKNGLISVAAELDREQTSSYSLIIRASDGGEPAQFNDVSVQVSVGDINDNPPRFLRSNYTVIKREDMAVNSKLVQLNVTDPDSSVNGPPFTFTIVKGNEDNDFNIDSDGILYNRFPFNREMKDVYELTVQVTDNGKPPLSSITHVTLEIIEPINPPIVKSPMMITIKSYEDDFPGGVIGWVDAVDADPADVLRYELANNMGNAFRVDPETGSILAQPDLDEGFYQLNVSVSDGQFVSYCDVQVTVDTVTTEMLDNSVTIGFQDLTPEKFLYLYFNVFKHIISNILRSAESADVQVISIQQSEMAAGDTEVLFAVEKSDRRGVSYYKPKSLERQINTSASSFVQRMGVTVKAIVADVCLDKVCDKQRRCESHVTFDQAHVTTIDDGEKAGFVSARHSREPICVCKERVEGCSDLPTAEPPRPQTPTITDPCSSNPCPAYRSCQANGDAFSCVCADNSLSCGGDPSLPMSFSGNSYMRYDLLDVSSLAVRVAVAIHTMEPNGVIMHGEGDDYSTLEIIDGFVHYTFDCGSGPANIHLTTRRVDDGQWHEVSISHQGNVATVTLDRSASATGSAAGDKRALNLNKIVFGARVADQVRARRETVSDGFIGCMGDMNVDGLRLERTGEGITPSNIGECPSKFLKACSGNPCEHEGSCIDYGYSFVCDCRPGWNGNRCEFPFTPCYPDPCANGGTCYSTGNDFQCDCKEPYSGRNCNEVLCPEQVCLNDGFCKLGSMTCNCTGTGYGGTYCQTELTHCSQNPCRYGHHCVQLTKSYKCCSPSSADEVCRSLDLDAVPNITAGPFAIGMVEIIGIVVAAVIAIVLVLLFAVFMRRRRRRRQSHHIHASANQYSMDTFKRDSKGSDYGYPPSPPSPRPPPLPDRPASYTPSNHNSLNNLDTDRYGYDDSQAYHGQPISQQPSLPPLPSNSASDSDSIAKPAWEFDAPSTHESYADGRDSAKNAPISAHHPLQHSHPCILPPARDGRMPLEPPAYDQFSHVEVTSMSSINTENDDDALPATKALPPADQEVDLSVNQKKPPSPSTPSSSHSDSDASQDTVISIEQAHSQNSPTNTQRKPHMFPPSKVSPVSPPKSPTTPTPVEQSKPLMNAAPATEKSPSPKSPKKYAPKSPILKKRPSKTSPVLETDIDSLLQPSKSVRFNMEPEISRFEADSSQSDIQTDSDSERSYADLIGLKIERQSEGSAGSDIGFNNIPPLDFLETQKALGVEGVQILADVSCQTVDNDAGTNGASNLFLESDEPMETMTEFHDTHQTVYITQNPKDAADADTKSADEKKDSGDVYRQKAYQWDCSDWMPAEPLSNIPEVQYETPESPTNTNLSDEDIEDEFVGEETDYPAENEDMPYPQGAMRDFQQQLANYPPVDDTPYVGLSSHYQQHPNQYLPKHAISNSTLPPLEAENEEDISDGLPYPQRGQFPGGAASTGDLNFDLEGAIANMDNMSMSVYTDTNASCSDVSGMCDPDSEMALSEYDSVDGTDDEYEEDLPDDRELNAQLKNLTTDV
ncbi:protocadherin Fat 1-like isoform X2 [Acanthaster planci]|uniref:Protocadherin Fat 1-like isoform X2 n=1 Tax=Acanthaster planci TaxID=133434 RepID=A0A8B7ZSI4_ACAPL|nr:protocadherin Fat 1-like isoform X2 [Acanthaster planci]